jgi:Uncharacterized protein conserved in bacteria
VTSQLLSTPALPTLGIIAGYGDLARDVITSCHAQGRAYFIIAYEGQTDPSLVQGHPHGWVTLGKVGKTLKLLHDHHCRCVVMAGYFNRPSWSEMSPDFKGAKLMANLIGKPMGDDGLFRVIINFFEAEGFTVLSPEEILSQPTLMPAGCLTNAEPDHQALVDIERGLKVARALGLVDVGQAVVIQQGLVLGVEALEGSDHLIARCGELQQSQSQRHLPGGVFVKVVKPNQDTRVDRSVIGPQTVQAAYEAGLRGIAGEANRVILLNQQASIALANQYNIFITGV